MPLRTYAYDNFSYLTSFNNGITTASYTYDGNNLRQSKTVDGVTTNHVWDGANMVMETSGTTVNKYYRCATGLIYSDIDGERRYYHNDEHGNVAAMTNAAGNVINVNTYDAFGNMTQTNESITDPFGYCGEYYDTELDALYLRNRYYSPSIGRFITEDPIKDGLNWYAYCGNNPTNHCDYTGLSDEDDLIASYQQVWQDAEAAYKLGIITEYEKNSAQAYAHSMAEQLRYQKEHPILTATKHIAEFVVFDFILGDLDGGTVYAADFTEDALKKMYEDETHFSAIMTVATVVAYDKGRTLVNTKINKDMVRVDIEFPQGGKKGNVHVQNKKTGEKWIIKNLDELDNLPKSIAKNKKIRTAVSKGLKMLSKLF